MGFGDIGSSRGDAAGYSDRATQVDAQKQYMTGEVIREKDADPINPTHYKKHASGVECIAVTEHFNFNLGNAIKYIWRHTEKGTPLDDLKKAAWYLDREIKRVQNTVGLGVPKLK